jgi:hypothetical protein
MTTKLASLLAAAGIATSIGCIQEDCLDTYLLNDATRTVSVEPEFTERVRDISLAMEARNNPWDFQGEHAYAENLKITCAPNRDNNCVDAHEYEFIINYVSPEGNRTGLYFENRAGYDASTVVDIELANTYDGSIECIVWSPECVTNGYVEIRNGVRHFVPTEYRPRTLVGTATAEIGMSAVCPAPLAPFKPVSEEDLQNSSQ